MELASDQQARWSLRWQESRAALTRSSSHVRVEQHFASAAYLAGLHNWLASVVTEHWAAHQRTVDFIDLGAGDGAVLRGVMSGLSDGVPVRPLAIDMQAAPDGWPTSLAWRVAELPNGLPRMVNGIGVALELLDEIPCEVATFVDDSWRYVTVNAFGQEALGEPITGEDERWLRRWATCHESGTRVEVGRSRDEWAVALCRRWERGQLIFIDYAIDAESRRRRRSGTLTGYFRGQQVPPVPDGRRNLTAHVAFDSLVDSLSQFGLVHRSRLRQTLRNHPASWWQPLSSWGDFEVVTVRIG